MNEKPMGFRWCIEMTLYISQGLIRLAWIKTVECLWVFVAVVVVVSAVLMRGSSLCRKVMRCFFSSLHFQSFQFIAWNLFFPVTSIRPRRTIVYNLLPLVICQLIIIDHQIHGESRIIIKIAQRIKSIIHNQNDAFGVRFFFVSFFSHHL